MTTDYHALITKMAAELDRCQQLLLDDRRQRHPLAAHARALLAEPDGAASPPTPYPPPRPPMTDRLQAIATAAGLCIVALMAWALLNTAAQCHVAGGTAVRGLFWLECIK